MGWVEGGSHAGLESGLHQCNMAQVSLDYYLEAEDSVPQILKERAAMRGWELQNAQVYIPEGMETYCTASLRTDKDMGHSWACFCL